MTLSPAMREALEELRAEHPDLEEAPDEMLAKTFVAQWRALHVAWRHVFRDVGHVLRGRR